MAGETRNAAPACASHVEKAQIRIQLGSVATDSNSALLEQTGLS